MHGELNLWHLDDGTIAGDPETVLSDFEKIMSDGDPLYTSFKFKQYCVRYEIDHDFSSARYAQSNGQAEKVLQHVKNILAKCVQDGTYAAQRELTGNLFFMAIL